ncbi:hypothetical protein GP486_000552 [Trichoglossum hirsutum]|uniref:Cation-transporting P-type ATPase N-terminal domain-containing protein n=1 Tax=Trichoglossum hirsutum TaxID=265104 RepID=A0A9P8LIT5_9PEZI|nr:hypothetical protein GP486_000552 [Trichoglossum hirsutum]
MVTVSPPPAADEANEPPLRSSSRNPNESFPVTPPSTPRPSSASWPSVGAQASRTPDCGPNGSQRPPLAGDQSLSTENSHHKAGGRQQEPVRSDAAAVVSRTKNSKGRVAENETGVTCVHAEDTTKGEKIKEDCTGDERAFSKGLVWEGKPNFAHAITFDAIAKGLDVNLQHGLSSAEAASRLARDGPNKLEEDEGVSIWKVLLRQVSNSLTMASQLTEGNLRNKGKGKPARWGGKGSFIAIAVVLLQYFSISRWSKDGATSYAIIRKNEGEKRKKKFSEAD